MDWIDVIIHETDTVIITQRLSLEVSGESSFKIDYSLKNVIGYHVECKKHHVKIAIDDLQSERVESSEAFCRDCMAGSPPVIRELSPMAQRFKMYLRHKEYTDAMNKFIDGLDL
jgi:hypothetical protein